MHQRVFAHSGGTYRRLRGLGKIEKERRERGKRRTIVTEGTGRECFVDGNDVGVSDTRPLLNWLECSLVHQAKIYSTARYNTAMKGAATRSYLTLVAKRRHDHLCLSRGILYYTNYQTCDARPSCSQGGQEYGNLAARRED